LLLFWCSLYNYWWRILPPLNYTRSVDSLCKL
jgi:hypothetical protein